MSSFAGVDVDLVGPFTHHAVVIGGYEVPHLAAHPANGGIVTFVLDGRLSLDVPVEQVDALALFLADAIAVASGYTQHPRSSVDEPFPRSDYHRLAELRV